MKPLYFFKIITKKVINKTTHWKNGYKEGHRMATKKEIIEYIKGLI